MKRSGLAKLTVAAVSAAMMLAAPTALGCAACFGRSDSALARGMNMGILSLLAVVGTVLASVAAFFIYLARKSASVTANPAPAERREPVTELQP